MAPGKAPSFNWDECCHLTLCLQTSVKSHFMLPAESSVRIVAGIPQELHRDLAVAHGQAL